MAKRHDEKEVKAVEGHNCGVKEKASFFYHFLQFFLKNLSRKISFESFFRLFFFEKDFIFETSLLEKSFIEKFSLLRLEV